MAAVLVSAQGKKYFKADACPPWGQQQQQRLGQVLFHRVAIPTPGYTLCRYMAIKLLAKSGKFHGSIFPSLNGHKVPAGDEVVEICYEIL